MNIPGKISSWDDHYPFVFVILRVTLGIILAFRGIFYLTSIQPLFHLIQSSSLNELNINRSLALFVCWVHLLGGTLIILGLLTRISAVAQIPILLGAIFFVDLNRSLSPGLSDLLLAILVLILSGWFAWAGAGKISMDHYIKTHLL